MSINIELPKHIEDALVHEMGGTLVDRAKEALAIALYQSEKVSIGQVAEMLAITVDEAAGLMKSRGIEAPYSATDYDRDQQSLERLLGP